MNLVEALNSDYTPLAGRDALICQRAIAETNFYSHAPRGARSQYLVTILLITSLYRNERRKNCM